LTFLARGVPALGFRVYHVAAAAEPPPGWTPADGTAAENAAFRVEADPARGGALSRIVDLRVGSVGRDLLRPGGLGAELVLQEEYATHPVWGEGPWHLLPKGPGSGTGAAPAAAVRAERCPIGGRVVTETRLGDLRITQEVLLWEGVDRIDVRTHVDGSIGQDHLLRVRFDADLPGAKPVAEVGFAAIGRSFGFPESDAGPHLWTLDTPVHTWAGLSAPVRLTLPGGRRHAIGVAEVVAPDGGTGRHAAEIRALLAALAGQGVTATCTAPDGPRYGALDVDSNLPDVRIVLGTDNAFAAAVLAAADPAYRAAAAGGGRVLLPPARPAAETWVPDADLRGPRDLPVLIVDGGADLAAAITALTDDLGDATIDVPYGTTAEPADDYSIGLLNQGTPSFVATADGTLYLSLMRSCSAWPCGVWLDGERRTAPDGSSFAWQHWTHTFAYSLVAGPGDWRDAGFVRAGAEYNHAVLATSVEPPTAVLTALKPLGNPMAAERPGDADPAAGLTLRLYESAGRPATARVRMFTGLAAPELRTPVEEPMAHRAAAAPPARPPRTTGDAAIELDLAPADVVTLSARPAAAPPPSAPPPSAPPREPAPVLGAAGAGPVFTRYWLHNTGPAPVGYLPVSVHLAPTSLRLPGAPATAQVVITVAGSGAPSAGRVELDVPAGLTIDAPALDYDLAADAHVAFPVTLRADGPAGTYFLAARIRDRLGQTLEDVVAVTVGTPDGEPLDVTYGPDRLALPPGGRGELLLGLRSRARGEIRGEATLLSPHGTWGTDLHITPWTRELTVAPGLAAELRYDVGAAPTTRPGAHWWTLVKVAYFGRLHYTRAIPIEIVSGD
jgi:hypothetical protein